MKDKSNEEKLESVGLTVKQVVKYSYKLADKEINTEFSPIEDSLAPYRFEDPCRE